MKQLILYHVLYALFLTGLWMQQANAQTVQSMKLNKDGKVSVQTKGGSSAELPTTEAKIKSLIFAKETSLEAGSVTIDASLGSNFHIGNQSTTINNIANGVDGQVVRVVLGSSNSNVTIDSSNSTGGSQILLDGGDFTYFGYKVLEFQYREAQNVWFLLGHEDKPELSHVRFIQEVGGPFTYYTPGIYTTTTASSSETCNTACSDDDASNAYDSGSGVCLQGWSTTSGTNLSCASTTSTEKVCLCLGVR